MATKRYRDFNHVEFVQGDVFNFLENRDLIVDVVVIYEVIEHIETQEKLLKHIWRAVDKGGRLFLSTPNRAKTPFYRKNPYHVRELNLEETERLVAKWFDIDIVKGQIQGLWAFFPQSFVAPVASRLGIHERLVRLNDRPQDSMTLIVSGLRKDLAK